jgi:hypothetical protein
MKTEDLFKYGVTPIAGAMSGEKFEVYNIDRDEVFVRNEKGEKTSFAHGTYKLWEPAKTLFEDDTIKPTWGNLKKAVEAKGLSDDTLIVTDPTTYDIFSLLSPRYRLGARARVVKHTKDNGEEEPAIMIY